MYVFFIQTGFFDKQIIFNQQKANIMKKTVLIFLCLAAFAVFTAEGSNFSRNGVGITGVQPTFEKRDLVINLGIGLPSSPQGTMGIPPVTASVEYGLIDNMFTENLNLGIGGIFGLQTYTDWGESHASLFFGVRAAVHYPLVENFDVHAGLMTSLRTNPNKVIPGVYIGGRYYFSDSFGVMAEVGYGITFLNVGVAFKF